jgi:chemotaxis protein MotA
MYVIGGCAFVIVAVMAGFAMAGGHVGALLHLSEVVTIGGASLGALIVMSPKKVITDLIRCVIQVIKGTPFNKQTYVELFGLLGELARSIRRDGLLSLEPLVSDPYQYPMLLKYPSIHKNHHAVEFLCSGLTIIMDGTTNAAQLTKELDKEIQVIEREHHAAVAVLSKTADALPGFGIVAAVLGIVVTMQAIDGPASEIGHKVGAALVGTFLGILMSYGFFAPMAARMEFLGDAEVVFYRTISSALVALSGGENPRDLISSARRLVGTDCRPSLSQMEQITKQGAKA